MARSVISGARSAISGARSVISGARSALAATHPRFPVVDNLVDEWAADTKQTADGVSIQSWTGRKGNAFIQQTAASQFKMDVDGMNGYPALVAQVDDFMTCDGLAAQFSGSDIPITVIMAVSRITDLGGTETFFSMGRNAATGFMSLRVAGSNDNFQARRGDDGGTNSFVNLFVSPSTFPVLTPVIFAMNFKGTTVDGWRNGTKVRSGLALDFGAATFTQFTLGCLRTNTNTNFAEMALGAVAVLSSASDEVISLFMNYYSAKYGITLSG